VSKRSHHLTAEPTIVFGLGGVVFGALRARPSGRSAGGTFGNRFPAIALSGLEGARRFSPEARLLMRTISRKISTAAFAALVGSLLVAGVGCGKKDAGAGSAPTGSSSAAASEPSLLGKLKEAVGSEITITRKPTTVGEKRSVDHTTDLTMNLAFGPKKIEFSEQEVSKRSEEVLALDGDTVTKVKVSYQTRKKTKTDNGRTGAPDKTKLDGRVVIVESVKGKVVITAEDGKPLDAPSKAAVAKDYKRFGKPDKTAQALPTRALKVGEEVKELTDALTTEMKEDMDGEKQGMVAENAKVVLEKADNGVATFHLSMTLRMTKGILKGTIPLAGSFVVRASDGALLKTDNAGPINLDITEADKKKGVSGTGTVKTVTEYTYP
jgi:hypothetical protein